MSSTAHQPQPKIAAMMAAADPIAQRWQQPSHPRHLCHFSGSKRASRRHKMTIQRLAPSYPPCNSA